MLFKTISFYFVWFFLFLLPVVDSYVMAQTINYTFLLFDFGILLKLDAIEKEINFVHVFSSNILIFTCQKLSLVNCFVFFVLDSGKCNMCIRLQVTIY